jgi:hypothetical protein
LRVTGRLDDAAREYAIARDVLTRGRGARERDAWAALGAEYAAPRAAADAWLARAARPR